MRKLILFLSGFSVVLLAGTAAARMGGGWESEGGGADGGKPPTTTAGDLEGEKPTAIDQPRTEHRDDEYVPKETTTTAPKGDEVAEHEETPKPEAEPKEEEEHEVDNVAPKLEILFPENNQHFEKKEVVFEGRTERGARVFAGKYEANVNDDGGWRIVLYLSPGANGVNFRAKDAAGNVSEASIKVWLDVEESTTTTKPDGEGEHHEWEFSAKAAFGQCEENPPFDVYWGTGKPGDTIKITSEYGSGTTTVHENGEWEVKVYFETAPVGQVFGVKVRDSFDHYKMFEFKRIG
jgi:hypothetical protein